MKENAKTQESVINQDVINQIEMSAENFEEALNSMHHALTGIYQLLSGMQYDIEKLQNCKNK